MIPKTQQKEKLLKDMSNERYRETRIAPKRTPPSSPSRLNSNIFPL